ncbi:hypothetical protein [Paenibacillus agricola]|uniref:hypothetical protein n=1 Tax=Paenibacillus agricola TaxID=2716264 RepID=UPI001FB68763|nr:hypothetical protein [Paenibacillus agricola]
MDNLLDQLLDISQQDEDLLELHFAPYNLSEMMRKIVSDYLLILDGQDFTIEVGIPDRDAVIDINQSLIERTSLSQLARQCHSIRKRRAFPRNRITRNRINGRGSIHYRQRSWKRNRALGLRARL